MEAISKGLDPRGSGGFKGYSLTGSNEDNRGGSDARHPSGMGMITNDGYYTYVDGKSDFGHSKVKLRGGSETIAVWKNLTSKGYNITKAQMLTAMEKQEEYPLVRVLKSIKLGVLTITLVHMILEEDILIVQESGLQM